MRVLSGQHTSFTALIVINHPGRWKHVSRSIIRCFQPASEHAELGAVLELDPIRMLATPAWLHVVLARALWEQRPSPTMQVDSHTARASPLALENTREMAKGGDILSDLLHPQASQRPMHGPEMACMEALEPVHLQESR